MISKFYDGVLEKEGTERAAATRFENNNVCYTVEADVNHLVHIVWLRKR